VYRTDGGAKCEGCGHGFTPDDLSLDVSGAWLCAACAHRKESDGASRTLADDARAKRRMRLLGVALLVVAAGAFAWSKVATRRGEQRTA
jgi:hypothetical protein